MSLELYLPTDPNVCDLFHAAAVDTWERIKFSRTTPRLRIHETTITQNLVYEMRLLKSRYPHWGFTLYESINEKTNGDDLELCVLHRNGQVYTYAMQAKILYHQIRRWGFEDGNYPRMNHEVGGTPQVDLLLAYSRDNGCIPLYLLYNFITFNQETPRDFQHPIPFDYRALGCTVISAYLLKHRFAMASGQLKGNIRFSELHHFHFFPWHSHPATPWERLVCFDSSLDEERLKDRWRLAEDHPVKGKDFASISDDSQWRQVIYTPEDLTGKAPEFLYLDDNDSSTGLKDSFDDSPPAFRPKFRLFISEEPKTFSK